MTGSELRAQFLNYFNKYDHNVVRSSSLVPSDDPTLLFTNAGMVQFKRVFLGEEKKNYTRATTSQKCVRAGGKHNDLENVGYTARHHTFFEMLGNFSFGDYFKEKAIEFAWDLLTNGYKLPVDKLWVSVYREDDESYDIWRRRIGVPEERIERLGEKDNFWAMGDTGPCGPCSEIHIDRGEAHGCGQPDCSVDCDCDRFLEIWNLVFMQYNRDESGTMTPLPKPSIDTGMGLERIASIIQNTPTNYETDLIYPIIEKTQALASKAYGADAATDTAMKVIADHSRSAAFLIGDGVLPSNEGRGYVLRRIMRRAIRYGRQIGLNRAFLHDTAGVVFDIMRDAYPELSEASAFITNVIKNEEARFSETLDNGLKLLGDCLADLKARGITTVPGDVMFKLYDTYGFPVDIVQDVVRDEKLSIDKAGFDKAMAQQRAQSRSVASFSNMGEAFKKLSAEGFKTRFDGYQSTEIVSRARLIVKDGRETGSAGAGDAVEVVTDATPFYGAAGGQVGDTGKINGGAGLEIEVEDTVKDPTGLIIHKGRVVSGTITDGDEVTLSVDTGRRNDTARNHTATHILHSALRAILGDHVKQAGSMVSPERLRFDFSHFSQVAEEEIESVERFVNERIMDNVPVDIDEMDIEAAMASGATALFEEKYGDTVRVISLDTFSRELCGGTHAGRTGDVGLFKILSESSVASGVRRIEAVTGKAALAHVQETDRTLRQAARTLKTSPDAVAERVEKTITQQKAFEKEIGQLKGRLAAKSADNATDEVRDVGGVAVLARKVAVDNPGALRDLADQFKDKIKSGVVVLGSAAGDKVLLVAIVTKDLTKKFHAGNIVKKVAGIVGGGGGGRPDMAQAGGSKPEKLDEAIEAVYGIVEEG
jgi:alanyl-tRNA synthetase